MRFGLLLSTPPEAPDYETAVHLASRALERGSEVYLYLVDDGVRNLDRPEIADLARRGVHLFLCAYGGQRRGIRPSDPKHADFSGAFSGLVVLSDLVKGCDTFVTF